METDVHETPILNFYPSLPLSPKSRLSFRTAGKRRSIHTDAGDIKRFKVLNQTSVNCVGFFPALVGMK